MTNNEPRASSYHYSLVTIQYTIQISTKKSPKRSLQVSGLLLTVLYPSIEQKDENECKKNLQKISQGILDASVTAYFCVFTQHLFNPSQKSSNSLLHFFFDNKKFKKIIMLNIKKNNALVILPLMG